MRRTGYTLLEVILATAIFTVVTVAIFSLGGSASRSYATSETYSSLQSAALHAMATIEAELAESGYVATKNPPYPAVAAPDTPPVFPYVIVNAAPGPEFGGWFASYSHTPCANHSELVTATGNPSYFGSVSGTQEIVYLKPMFDSKSPTNRHPVVDSTTGNLVWDSTVAASPYYPYEEYSFLLEKGSDGVDELVHRRRYGAFYDGTNRHVLARHVQRVWFEDYESGKHAAGWNLANNQVRVTLWLAKLDAAKSVIKTSVQSVVTLRNKG